MTAAVRQRVVFVLPALTAGGAERVLITLMNGIDRARFEPVFLTVSNQGELRSLIDKAVPYHSLNQRRVLTSIPLLYKKLKELKPNIVVSTMAHMNFAVLLTRPFLPGVKFIVREAITPTFIMEEHPATSFLIEGAYKILYRIADKVISPAQAIIDEFDFLLNMNRKNFVLLHNPVNIEQIRAEENKGIKTGGARDKTVQFVAAGRLHRQKGFDRLIEKLSNFKCEYDWRLIILGEGPERHTLELLIHDKGLKDKIFMPGLSSNPWPHYAAADCFLMPSRHEGLPNVVLESLACGTPVIATQESGGIAEIAEEAPAGSVTVVHDMDEFISTMEKIRPNPAPQFRPSLLPAFYGREAVVHRFEEILLSV